MATISPRDDRQASTEPASLLGRDELNLAEFPITLLADYAPKGEKTLTFRGGNGRLTVTGSDAYGLPTALDADVIVALIYLTKLRNDFQDVKVNFSRYELVKLLNWPDKGSSYTRLDQALNRWGGVWLVYDKCWWNNKTKRYVSAKMHILESVVITEPGKTRTGRSHPPLSTFTWNRTFIESCQADNLRQLDLDTYFSLKSAISKRLYRFLGKRFYRQADWTFDLAEIAFDRVGLSRSYADAYKIKEKLQPAIYELERIGFLKPLSRHERYSRVDRGQWTIRLARQHPGPAAPPPAPAAPAEAEASPPPPTMDAGPSLIAELACAACRRRSRPSWCVATRPRPSARRSTCSTGWPGSRTSGWPGARPDTWSSRSPTIMRRPRAMSAARSVRPARRPGRPGSARRPSGAAASGSRRPASGRSAMKSTPTSNG